MSLCAPPCWVPRVRLFDLCRSLEQLHLASILLKVLQQLLTVPLLLALEGLRPQEVG